MTSTRQRDCTTQLARCRSLRIQAVLKAVSKRRLVQRKPAFTSTTCLMQLAQRYLHETNDYMNYIHRRMRISNINFYFNFNVFSDGECLAHFRFKKEDIKRVIPFLGWPRSKTATKRNRYRVSSLLDSYILLRRLACPVRWKDLEEFFGKHGPQLSEIFWEAIEHLLDSNWHLLGGPISQDFMASHVQRYSDAIVSKNNGLPNCVRFIDGTVLGIARPNGDLPQRVVYNGHKRKHALKFQVVNTPDGLIQHAHGPVEGRRHDWTLYVHSSLDEILPGVLEVNGRRYCIYGDSGYNGRWYIEVPFQGSNLTTPQSGDMS